ncbi:hypothetical protein [Maritimibacter sp. HL-12]|uniref:hypothetical protein n=1 Tax=Maritimibacter sp. HL-12 TaxID=1162418 RepID=UPI000A0F37E9|nr:hypothetical protein [Maritimibacter sp. HL-12]SMH58358.1 hypothetical protein SAMN05661107_3609 [Maritimibacter sp. HL-12]
MKRYSVALVVALAAAGVAAPIHAEGGLAFEPVAPEGLDETATEMVAALQEGMPAQLVAFEQAGFGAFGALAVPRGVALAPEKLASVANHASPDAAREAVLDVCQQQNGAPCTVIGLLVPEDN